MLKVKKHYLPPLMKTQADFESKNWMPKNFGKIIVWRAVTQK
jgi:hypothetical protein